MRRIEHYEQVNLKHVLVFRRWFHPFLTRASTPQPLVSWLETVATTFPALQGSESAKVPTGRGFLMQRVAKLQKQHLWIAMFFEAEGQLMRSGSSQWLTTWFQVASTIGKRGKSHSQGKPGNLQVWDSMQDNCSAAFRWNTWLMCYSPMVTVLRGQMEERAQGVWQATEGWREAEWL